MSKKARHGVNPQCHFYFLTEHYLWSQRMPQLTFEYNNHLDFDLQSRLARLHSELAAAGDINLKRLKSRAIRHIEYRIADGTPDYAFVHVNL
jgi:5-carboxymethyl-2-hydroxymuconate isomerase